MSRFGSESNQLDPRLPDLPIANANPAAAANGPGPMGDYRRSLDPLYGRWSWSGSHFQ